jgi:hypothetical protein
VAGPAGGELPTNESLPSGRASLYRKTPLSETTLPLRRHRCCSICFICIALSVESACGYDGRLGSSYPAGYSAFFSTVPSTLVRVPVFAARAHSTCAHKSLCVWSGVSGDPKDVSNQVMVGARRARTTNVVKWKGFGFVLLFKNELLRCC